jgi:hypothetical protein
MLYQIPAVKYAIGHVTMLHQLTILPGVQEAEIVQSAWLTRTEIP